MFFPGKTQSWRGVNLTLLSKNPLYKGIGASEISSFNLTLTSPKPHSSKKLTLEGRSEV